MTAITTEHLIASYGNKPIIHDLTLEIPEKKITTLIGPNGCGKSTLLKSISRLLKTQSGSIYLDGQKIQHYKTKALAKKMAILPQSMEVPEGLTVFELVSYGRFPYQKGFGTLSTLDHEKIHWAIEMTGLSSIKNQNVDALSGGQRQRVWIAMALAQDTNILILDEPTTYLDMAHQLDILLLLEKLNQDEERTIIMAIHDLNHASRFAHHMIAMKDGALVTAGTPKEVMTVANLKTIFDIEATLIPSPQNGNPICLTCELSTETTI